MEQMSRRVAWMAPKGGFAYNHGFPLSLGPPVLRRCVLSSQRWHRNNGFLRFPVVPQQARCLVEDITGPPSNIGKVASPLG